MNKKERMYERIEKHGRDLIKLFNLPADTDPIALSKRLFKLENKAHRIAVDYCNGIIQTEQAEKEEISIIKALGKIVFPIGTIPAVPVFVNWDARGYALKVDDAFMRGTDSNLHRDWGGYGIIAPDFTESN